jgi:triacylglycerol lipase
MNIVLAPGVLGFNQFGRLEYFNGVAPHLRTVFPDVQVLAATTDLLGTVADRAELLARQIVAALSPTAPEDERLDPSQPIHILAHSMGGLDARLLIFKDLEGLRPRIATLTGIGTPHLGSPVATFLNQGNLFTILPRLPLIGGALADGLRDLRAKTNAVDDLSEEVASRFDHDHRDGPGVRYFEVVGVGRQGRRPTSMFFKVCFQALGGPGQSDGVVPLRSATRNFTRTPIAEWPGDHADLIGHDLDNPSGPPAFPHLAKYEELVRELKALA